MFRGCGLQAVADLVLQRVAVCNIPVTALLHHLDLLSLGDLSFDLRQPNPNHKPITTADPPMAL